MNCRNIMKWSSQALDGELDREREGQFKDHIRECTHCRLQWENFKLLPGLIGEFSLWESTPEEDQAIRAIWRPSLRTNASLHMPNLLTGLWPKVFWKFRLAGVLTGSVLALVALLMTPIQVARLQFKLEKLMQADNPIYFRASWPVARNAEFHEQIENQTITPLVFSNQELSEGERRFNHYAVRRFTDYESSATHEDSFAVLTLVTPEGHSSIQDVLRSPRDWNLMQRFGQLLADSQSGDSGSATRNSGVIIRSFQRVLVIG
jgi:hypothetical protein